MPRAIKYSSLQEAVKRCVRIDGGDGTGVIMQSGLVFSTFHNVYGQGEVRVENQVVEEVITDLDLATKLDLMALIVNTDEFDPVAIHKKAYRNQEIFYVDNPGTKSRAIQFGRVKANNWGQLELCIDTQKGASGSGVYNRSGQLMGLIDSFDPPEPGKDCRAAYAIPGRILEEFFERIKKRMHLRS
jgi:hypothetical protein